MWKAVVYFIAILFLYLLAAVSKYGKGKPKKTAKSLSNIAAGLIAAAGIVIQYAGLVLLFLLPVALVVITFKSCLA